jgi:hypothetical protein
MLRVRAVEMIGAMLGKLIEEVGLLQNQADAKQTRQSWLWVPTYCCCSASGDVGPGLAQSNDRGVARVLLVPLGRGIILVALAQQYQKFDRRSVRENTLNRTVCRAAVSSTFNDRARNMNELSGIVQQQQTCSTSCTSPVY